MNMREQQINDTLRVLDEAHRLGHIERDEYRRRRRRLLESLCGAIRRGGPDTVRRAVPAGVTLFAHTTVPRDDAGHADVAALRDRWDGMRFAAVCLAVFSVLAGAAAVYWFLTAR